DIARLIRHSTILHEKLRSFSYTSSSCRRPALKFENHQSVPQLRTLLRTNYDFRHSYSNDTGTTILQYKLDLIYRTIAVTAGTTCQPLFPANPSTPQRHIKQGSVLSSNCFAPAESFPATK